MRIARFGTLLVWIVLAGLGQISLAPADKPAPPSPQRKKPVVVRVRSTEEGYQLLRDGQPYFIKGAGGSGPMKAFVAAGGNSWRTWGTDNLETVLDEADRLGVSVAVGIWLGHERHGFHYNNADQVARQYETVRETIQRFKDHPAVLLWGLGNEMEGYEKGDNAAIWSAINNLAALAKKIDPNHPTLTTVAEIGGDRVKNIHRLCPDIDLVGINSYGGAATVPKRYRAAGGTKPYLLTEFGPPGSWESKKTSWGAALELTSSEKAEHYRRAYREAVAEPKGLCLGSYAFTWGQKQEATATWFGMLLADGSRLGAVDAMTECWTGKPPANRCPQIGSLKLVGPERVAAGAVFRAELVASDPDGDPLRVKWVLQSEAASLGIGGDAEAQPPTFPEALVKSDAKQAEIKAPEAGGGYRLFAYVSDGQGGAAVANLPLWVKGPTRIPRGKPVTVPFVLYDEASRKDPPYLPTGWMGNAKGLKLTENCTDKPHGGKTCLRVDYQDKDGWAGIVWQHPGNDWGNRPGGWDITGATRLSFWARGEKGGEILTAEFGLIDRDKTYYDTAKGKRDKIQLTATWQQFHIDLTDKDLTRIKTGFACIVTGAGTPLTFYLDDIQYE